jgi:isocitrate dehydrogenase
MKNYQSVVLRIRKELDLFANYRPVRGNGFDILIVRENTEGLYSGIEEIGPDRATTLRLVTRRGTERIVRAAIREVKKRKHLTIGHKANVLKSDVFFRNICLDEAKRFAAKVDGFLIMNRDYFNLIAANIGAVIMPWMIFYQQGAIVDKGLCCSCEDNYQCCRWDTAIAALNEYLTLKPDMRLSKSDYPISSRQRTGIRA